MKGSKTRVRSHSAFGSSMMESFYSQAKTTPSRISYRRSRPHLHCLCAARLLDRLQAPRRRVRPPVKTTDWPHREGQEQMMSSSSSSTYSVTFWDYLNFLVLRPILAISFVSSFILLGWVLAWKLVLVHVPLVQEIFGLRKKPPKPTPPARRFTQFYNNIDAPN